MGCGFGESHRIADAEGALFDDLALVATDDGAALLWSDRSGLYLQPLGGHGAPSGPRRRLRSTCPGGVGAARDGDALVVACAVPADRDRGREGSIVVLRVEAGSVRTVAQTGPVGAQSRGVSVVVDGARTVVGWRDADVFTARARTAVIRGGVAEESTSLSSLGPFASAPSLAVLDGRLVLAWTESWFDASGEPSGHLFVQREGDPPMPSLDVSDVDVKVHLTSDGRGPMVAVRDRRPRNARHRAFLGRLDERLRLEERALHAPLRADSEDGHPMLVPCGDHVFVVATRRSSRGVTMVNLRRLDGELRPAEGEQQIYEYHARFPQALGVCLGESLLLAVGERQSEIQPVPRLRTFELSCAPGRAHERTPTIDSAQLEPQRLKRPLRNR